MARILRHGIVLALDLLASVGSVLLAFVIRFALEGKPIPELFLSTYLRTLSVILPLRVVVFTLFGLYRQLWAHAGVNELLHVVWAASVDAVISSGLIYLISAGRFPRSVFIISWFITTALMTLLRLLIRLRREWLIVRLRQQKQRRRLLIFGAGDTGALLAKEVIKYPNLGFFLVGFLDDDPDKQGYYVAGKRVLGTRNDLRDLAERHAVTDIIIAASTIRNSVVRELLNISRDLGLQIKTLPGLHELIGGRIAFSKIRDIQIDDLLGREEVKVDLEEIASFLEQETVLVTGAGGSIGSELCRQIALYRPKELVLLGHGENSIYEIDMELRSTFSGITISPVIADVKDEPRISSIFQRFRPGVVFHAAAHKHVPLMEKNPEEAIKNNVLGTYYVAKAALAAGTRKFVLVSSDKAVNPTSVMGATKRIAEVLIQSLNQAGSTAFIIVRFGNVLGSRGSVIPLFQKQIAAGGPVTVTDPEMERFFMTIPEAVQLVIQAASMGTGNETFVLDMGRPVRIIDLARDMIRLSGLDPDHDIAIEITGSRPGEKMYEELMTATETSRATRHERIFCVDSPVVSSEVAATLLDQLDELASTEVFEGPILVAFARSIEETTLARDTPAT